MDLTNRPGTDGRWMKICSRHEYQLSIALTIPRKSFVIALLPRFSISHLLYQPDLLKVIPHDRCPIVSLPAHAPQTHFQSIDRLLPLSDVAPHLTPHRASLIVYLSPSQCIFRLPHHLHLTRLPRSRESAFYVGGFFGIDRIRAEENNIHWFLFRLIHVQRIWSRIPVAPLAAGIMSPLRDEALGPVASNGLC